MVNPIGFSVKNVSPFGPAVWPTIGVIFIYEQYCIYRVSHKTQLVNSFECLPQYAVLDIKEIFLYFISLKKIFYTNIFYVEINFTIQYFFILFRIKQLNKLWKKTFITIHQLLCFVGHPVTEMLGSSCGILKDWVLNLKNLAFLNFII